MWIPRDWADIERAIGVQIEGPQLDFKKELPSGNKLRDIAKDAAAMSLEGGVIVVGVDEVDAVAIAITPIKLSGAIEQVAQVIDSTVTPSLAVEIVPLRKNDGDQEGVLVIAIAPSWSAPHQYSNRFPARSGAITTWLGERELERLFLRRSELQRSITAGSDMTGHKMPADADFRIEGAVGLMRVHLRPLVLFRHPAEPRLGPKLSEAAEQAGASIGAIVKPTMTPKAFDFLREWQPADAYGWRAGMFIGKATRLAGGVAVGGVYRYGGGFSFTVTVSLTANFEPDAPEGALCAQEHHWAAETLGLLSIGGHFFAPFAEAGLLRVDLDLGGLQGAVSWEASQGVAFGSGAPTVSDNHYKTGGVFSARDLARNPREATHDMLDPFMVTILSPHSNVVRSLEASS